MDCSPRASQSSVASVYTGASNAPSVFPASPESRLVSVLSIDNEAGVSDDAFPPSASYGHRDDWELQYMLSGAMDEVYQRLFIAASEGSTDAAVTEAASVLEKARE